MLITANALAAWQRRALHSNPLPNNTPNSKKPGKLTTLGAAESIRVEDSIATLGFTLPRQAVSLLKLHWLRGGILNYTRAPIQNRGSQRVRGLESRLQA